MPRRLMHDPRMNLRLVTALSIVTLAACAGLGEDIQKGAGSADREVNSKTGHGTTVRDSGAPSTPAAAPDGGDAGAISM